MHVHLEFQARLSSLQQYPLMVPKKIRYAATTPRSYYYLSKAAASKRRTLLGQFVEGESGQG